MTDPTPIGLRTDLAHVELIHERLAELRRQTSMLAQRSAEVQERAREQRSAEHPGCSHREEAAALAATAESLQQELDGLRVAMQTRGVIEQAKGMLMLEQRCDEDAAFQVLVELSQTSHRKLVDVARSLVSTWTAGSRAHA